MTAEGAPGAAAAGERPAPVHAAAGQSFASALARIRAGAGQGAAARPSATLALDSGAQVATAATALSRCRRAGDRSALVLRERREEADPSCLGGTARPPPEVLRPGGPEAQARLFAPAALENVALALSREAGRQSVEVRLANGAGVHLTRGAGGVELVLEVAPALRRLAEAELPALDAALRARGVAVASAAVRPSRHSPARVAIGLALTGGRPSDTTASPPQGTVAKW